jgi:DNA-binding NtrC family response regulator
MRNSASVLVVSGTADHYDELAAAISSSGLSPTYCNSLETARSLASEQEFSMMLCDDRLSGDLRTVIREVSRVGPALPVIVFSCRDDWKSYLDTLRAGAFDCVVLPTAPGEFARIVRAALRTSSQGAI